MDTKAMFNISYGLFVLTANKGGRDNGCIINTVTQVTSAPLQVTIAVNKMNYTHDLIAETGKFTASILSEKAAFDIFQRFGFQSGRTADKFAGFDAVERTANGTLAVTRGTNAFLSADVTQKIDVGTHTIFLAKVVAAETLDDTPSATYTFYHQNIKPKPQPPKAAPGKTIWHCKICGYEYEGDELPADFICPICKHPASDFEKVTA